MTPHTQQSILLLAQAKQWVSAQNYPNAVQALQQSVRLDPQNTVAWQEFINLLINLNELPNALKVVNAIPATVYQRSWVLQDRHAVVLSLLEKYEQALPIYLAFVDKADNHHGRLYSNIAACYFHLRDDENAFVWMKKAVAKTNDSPSVDLNLAALYTKINDIGSARAVYENAIKRFPQDVEVCYAYACFLLTDEQYEKGFQLYRNRWLSKLYDNQQLNLSIPHWKGEHRKSLLIIKEQGVGDEVLFSLFLPTLLDKVEQITVLGDYRLQPLFERSFPSIQFLPYVERKTVIDEARYDAHLYFADAGGYAHQAIGQVKNFLKSDAAKTAALREKYQRLFPHKKLIGFSWKSTRQGWQGEGRNIEMAQWESVLKNPYCQFISLQYGDVQEELAYAKEVLGVDVYVDTEIDCKNDLEGLAAQMSALDLVISAANTNAHLAAALGRPTWVTVPCGPGLFWCWGYREQTPFYPEARLFRATKSEAWAPVVVALTAALIEFCQDR